ncbi:HTH-type transcriptional regulator NorG [Peribacillus sp. Bi96]|uniref:aminotransferase-like domain-containing protein n=1 Tax=unclassified Peribacillus TaxID=2675266 RepID=UPI001D90DCD0|nr:PLP-dependent aminotransferase family protein [Peribacillus sp. Bi96]CAH0239441.1 HTH-type transcriptional regulator NorG [Peribacillus sp. Bi96]
MFIEWKPNRPSNRSLHQQIVEWMQQQITRGEWPVATKLPSQRSLADSLGVNRSTIISAIEELIADGLLETKVGSGTFVSNNTWNVLVSSKQPDWKNYVRNGLHEPNLKTIQDINQYETDTAIIRLGTGELSPSLLPTKKIEKTLQTTSFDAHSLGYSEPKGDKGLRHSISDYLKSKGVIASPSSLMIVSGGLQALQLISVGLLQKGSMILHESPSYLNSVHPFQSAGMHLVGLSKQVRESIPTQIKRINGRQKASLFYTVPTFNNPTNTTWTKEERLNLLSICNKEQIPIIEDDVYSDLWFENEPPLPIKSQDTDGLVLYIGSMSKTLSPGLRIGWIAGPITVIERLADIKMQMDYGSSALSQHLVAEWLTSGQYSKHLEWLRYELKVRRDFTLTLLNQYFKGIAEWQIPQGGFYIWLKLCKPIVNPNLFKQAIKENILINPGYIYEPSNNTHLRLSYSYASEEELAYGIQTLSKIIRRLI